MSLTITESEAYFSLVDNINKEIQGLREKQDTNLRDAQKAQREVQRLQDTNLVISGAIQALQHVLQQHKKPTTPTPTPTQQLPTLSATTSTEALPPTTVSSRQAAASPASSVSVDPMVGNGQSYDGLL